MKQIQNQNMQQYIAQWISVHACTVIYLIEKQCQTLIASNLYLHIEIQMLTFRSSLLD